MIGRKLEEYYPERSPDVVTDDVILEVNNLTKKGQFEDISFKVKKGEVLGFAGLVGAGRTEIMKTIFGEVHYDSGNIIVEGTERRLSLYLRQLKKE